MFRSSARSRLRRWRSAPLVLLAALTILALGALWSSTALAQGASYAEGFDSRSQLDGFEERAAWSLTNRLEVAK